MTHWRLTGKECGQSKRMVTKKTWRSLVFIKRKESILLAKNEAKARDACGKSEPSETPQIPVYLRRLTDRPRQASSWSVIFVIKRLGEV
ncbi:hypothetical protein JOC27_001622 [Sporolactobacillus spathodeae]|uniref:Uncharacterized protein n=1 Tax=Sporolactobacillus spathodeae TaxID=1465502 RepID=A0ABS2Q8Q6_9BACL|nr:hypothetical protein [Sporolactobacillus spathodeae]